jgi:hypothetical protein
MPITLEQAKQLNYDDILYADDDFNRDGTKRRHRVVGKVKTWKRNPDRIKVPLKHGLYNYGELTNGTFEGNQYTLDLSMVSLKE